MQGGRVVVDGLWRCLCPSVDVTTLSKFIGPPRSPRQPPIPCPHSNSHAADKQNRREYRRVAVRAEAGRQHNEHESVEKARIKYLKQLAKRNPWIPGALFGDVDDFATRLGRIPTKTIYAALKELPGATGTYSSVVKLVEYLVKERKEKPNAMLYESLIRANIDKDHGSAEIAGQLLKEMENLDIPTSPQIYQALLEVTAVHPDYVLRNTVLFEMKNRWYSPTAESSVNIVLGLLRDNQYELALERLEELQKDSVTVPPWLYDIFLYVFGELGFHEETLSILKYRFKVANINKEPISLNSWQFLLDVFSRDAFYEGIKYIWDRSVSPGYINPPDGVIMNTINAASNHGDATLTIGAIQMFSGRGRKLELHHYEPLVDIYTQQKDLQKAFTTLCIMDKAGLRPDLSSTRSIFRLLRESSTETDNALEILNRLRLHYKVPSAAFNVVLEAIELHQGFKVALDLYRSVRQVCADGPDLETYHILFSHCTMRKSMNFLFADLEAFSIQPTQTTYDHLIRISTMQDNYEQAFQFLERMRSSKAAGVLNDWWMGKNSALAIIRRCILAEDIRAQELIEECRKRGMSIDAEVQQLVEYVQEQKESVEPNTNPPIKGAPSVAPDTVVSSESDQSPRLNAISDWG